MSETTNENINTEEGKVIEMTQPLEGPSLNEDMSPKLVGKKVIQIETSIFDNGQQSIDINTPEGATVAENVGMLHIAASILLRGQFN